MNSATIEAPAPITVDSTASDSAAMNLALFEKQIESGGFFDSLGGSFSDKARMKTLLKWLTLLKTEAVFNALRSNNRIIAAIKHGDANDLLAQLLRQFLTDLKTRRDAAGLKEFWNWCGELQGYSPGLPMCSRSDTSSRKGSQ